MVARSVLLTLVAVSVSLAADSGLISLAPADTKVVMGMHVDRSVNSPFGQFLMKQMQKDDADFQKFVTATGFDPRRDLTEVITVTSADQKGHGLVLARGTFDLGKIQAAATQQGAAFTNYKDVQVISGKAGSNGWIAFLDSRTALVGDADSVKAAIDRRGSAPALDFKLSSKVQDVSNRYDAWMVSTAPMSNFAGRMPDQQLNGALKGDMIQGIEMASGGVQFGTDIQVSAEAVTRSDKDASALVDVVKFLAGMVQLNRDKPEVGNFATILDTLQLKSSGNTMSLSLTVPEPQLEQLMQPKANARKRAVKKVDYTTR